MGVENDGFTAVKPPIRMRAGIQATWTTRLHPHTPESAKREPSAAGLSGITNFCTLGSPKHPECSPRASHCSTRTLQNSSESPQCKPRAPFTAIYNGLGPPCRATKPDPNTNRIYNEAAKYRLVIFTLLHSK